MIHYRLFYNKPHKRSIQFEATFPTNNRSTIRLQLPAWRPGRYELGNFAQYIQNWEPQDENGKVLDFIKVTKDLWEVKCENTNSVRLNYGFYASILNAGSTFLSDEQLYVNPVNCFFYDTDALDVQFQIDLDLPESYEVACGLTQPSKHQLVAKDVQELMDGPFICSANMTHWTYTSENIPIHIWIEGKHRIDKDRLIKEFQAFTDSQIRAFKGIPCTEYHFLFQFPATYVRHGVEHENSTVIALGPSELLNQEKHYDEILGISCHELYHTWNIKNIRPAEMMPYDFTKENYSRLGYVAEGVTTYFGDQFLHRSGVFQDQKYFATFGEYIQRHFDNYARFNYSVAESSFDTWLDGYKAGTPHRKVSIYVEGCLTAFLTDVAIIKHSDCVHSLDDVMLELYNDFGLKGIGYAEEDYKRIVQKYAGASADAIFENLIYGREDFEPYLNDAFDFLGLKLEKTSHSNLLSSLTGLRFSRTSQGLKVLDIAPGSPGESAGIWIEDTITSIGKRTLNNNEGELIDLDYNDSTINLQVISEGVSKVKEVKCGSERFFPKYTLRKVRDSKSFEFWKNR